MGKGGNQGMWGQEKVENHSQSWEIRTSSKHRRPVASTPPSPTPTCIGNPDTKPGDTMLNPNILGDGLCWVPPPEHHISSRCLLEVGDSMVWIRSPRGRPLSACNYSMEDGKYPFGSISILWRLRQTKTFQEFKARERKRNENELFTRPERQK